MGHLTTFYFSRLLGCDIFDARENILGNISDVWVQVPPYSEDEAARPKIAGIIIRSEGKKKACAVHRPADCEVRYKI